MPKLTPRRRTQTPRTPTQARRRRLRVGLAVGGVALLSGTGTVLADGGFFSANGNPWPYQPTGPSPVLAAVGDIACQPGNPVEKEKASDVCSTSATPLEAQSATADQIENMHPNLVAILGDEQYQVGRLQDFLGSFDTTYGAFKFLQRPAPGNHEFYSLHGQTGVNGNGYFDYYNGYQHNPADGSPVLDTYSTTQVPGSTFTQPRPRPSGQAGQTGQGWYSYNLGAWHIISLNVECAVQAGGCSPTGSWFAGETRWLADDLNTNRSSCTLAYWHQPTFTAGNATPTPGVTSASPEGAAAATWWQLLYDHGADVVLNGHDHIYARYAPVDPTGKADPRRGIREFIVGTGGESLDAIVPNVNTPNLQASSAAYYGVMGLTLRPGGYDWNFASALKSPAAPAGTPAGYSDTGSGRCHNGGALGVILPFLNGVAQNQPGARQ